MTTQSANISVVNPVSQAIDRVKLLLFQPFDLNKWFLIGFCAWLAQMGEAGGRANFGNFGSHGNGKDVRQAFQQARNYVMDHLNWILPLAIAVVVVILVLGVVMMWLNSRGKFMFLHCVALDKAEISVPWHKFERQGNSLFLFRLMLALIGMILMLPLVVFMIVLVVRMIDRGAPDLHDILEMVGVVLTLIAVGMVFGLIRKLTVDFVVPIMSLRGRKCVAAWRELLGLMSANLGNFVLYLLFQFVLGIAIGTLVLTVFLMTCCIACCLMIIPYLGTVLLLPILVFKRSYSLHYLAQYGREYDVFAPAAAPTPDVAPPLPPS